MARELGVNYPSFARQVVGTNSILTIVSSDDVKKRLKIAQAAKGSTRDASRDQRPAEQSAERANFVRVPHLTRDEAFQPVTQLTCKGRRGNST